MLSTRKMQCYWKRRQERVTKKINKNRRTKHINCALCLHANRFDAQTQTDRKVRENGNKNEATMPQTAIAYAKSVGSK